MAEFAPLVTLPHVHAAIVRGALESEDVTVILDGPDTASAHGIFGTLKVTLMVPQTQLLQAREVLAQIERESTPYT